jgi:hypothetical protein
MFKQQLLFAIDELVSSPSRDFYEILFDNIDLSNITPNKIAHTGRKPTDFHALIRSFIVMKCERFVEITDLWDFLNNNRIIVYLCGFGFNLPSYSVFQRFIKNLDTEILEQVMQEQVLRCAEAGLISAKTLAQDSTPIYANVSNNNPKNFMQSKFSKDNPPSADKDCKLGFRSNSNAIGEVKGEFYWGYKEHILIDVNSGLPICSLTTGANTHDSTVVLDMLAKTHKFLPLNRIKFLADKGYDTKQIYDKISELYNGKCFIPLNRRGSKSRNVGEDGYIVCEAGLVMHKDGIFTRPHGDKHQKFCCPVKGSRTKVCPCNHEKWGKCEKRNRGCVRYIPYSDNLRYSINRETNLFKRIYAMRTEVERYNSRFKALGTEQLRVRNAQSTKNLNLIAHISLLTVALSAAAISPKCSHNALKTLKRAC